MNDQMNIAWLSVYNPRKINKKIVKSVNLVLLIQKIKETNFRLPIVSKLIKGVVNLYNEKIYTIYEEMINLIAIKQKKPQTNIKTHPILKIDVPEVLVIQPTPASVNLDVNDYDPPEDFMVPSFSYNDSIEELREIPVLKKIKKLNIFLDKKNFKKLENKNFEILELEKKLINFLKNNKNQENTSLSIERANSLVEPFYDFEVNDVCLPNYSDLSYFSINSLPNYFIFNELIYNLGRREKANCFYKLIRAVNEGKINAVQESEFGEIECNLVN